MTDTTSAAAAFAPFEDLAAALLPHAEDAGDGAHDVAHLLRVFHNAMRLQATEGGDAQLLAAAVLLHDCVSVEKNSPHRAEASRRAADKATAILADLGWQPEQIDAVAHAIHAHSYSANVEPVTLEARILQDADRLDSLGMIGVARTFYIAGRMGSKLYHAADPRGMDRPLDDRTYGLDHFETKLMKLSQGFKTDSGKAMAAERHRRLVQFRDLFLDEI